MEETYELPGAAINALSDPGIKLELHCISFSHYCERARWALRLMGLTYKEVNYLPLAHVPAILKLQRLFKQGPGKNTASSRSPTVTPVLAIYTADGQPLCLLANSALIMRFASLRAEALGSNPAYRLYGDSLRADSSQNPAVITGTNEEYKRIAELELRSSGVIGIEVRRVMYYYMLPSMKLGGTFFNRNSSGRDRWFAWPLYFMSRLLLPMLLKINKTTAERGKQRLIQEFDFFDKLLLQQQLQQHQKSDSVTPNSAGTKHPERTKLPYYLCGDRLSAADVSLATLGGYIVRAPYQVWTPGLEDWPGDLQDLIKGLRDRPTGRYILDLWQLHGPTPQAKL